MCSGNVWLNFNSVRIVDERIREAELGISEWVAVVSVVVALLTLAVQHHLTRRQDRAEARARQYERTQTLILKALDDPELLEAISGSSEENQKLRRYRQLWFNQVEMFFRQCGLYDRVHWEGTVNDIRSFMVMPEMRSHWQEHQHYYAQDFRDFMNGEVYRAEPPLPETPPLQGQASTT